MVEIKSKPHIKNAIIFKKEDAVDVQTWHAASLLRNTVTASIALFFEWFAAYIDALGAAAATVFNTLVITV